MTHPATAAAPASVSTHILDTSLGRPAAGVPVRLSARATARDAWQELGGATTDADGRCKELPALPAGTTGVRLRFEVEPYLGSRAHGTTRPAEARQDAPGDTDSGAFFPEVTVAFTVAPGEHYHVPLLLNPFGYSVYRGS
ncbi:hydroxyisourate hydrolase [Streptomyces palmae]|uniref:5-hydroxyisourate hydrolase n=1 Tax=Streptomyces palmae TaxID=1701085 RepID=A0A4Z0H8G9_9ACTN|nr:hydroxyisourate hydrolase [Streptomyces palmae]TGB12660.1 hydroxyisourate hydrolase [Streptomyces palmae]